MLVERGIYETGNYGWNNNEIVLEKFDNHVLTSSSCHPKILIKKFCYFLMPIHQHGLCIDILIQR